MPTDREIELAIRGKTDAEILTYARSLPCMCWMQVHDLINKVTDLSIKDKLTDLCKRMYHLDCD